jgi:enamine deaminase RidA (YjgF/YER057c/UK114 family)
MQYKTITDENRHATATISMFTTEKGVSEYQLVIQIMEQGFSFPEQLKSVFSLFNDIRENDLRNTIMVFLRVFLSDAANQTQLLSGYLPDNKDHLSIIEQPPLNSTKIALWAYLQTGMKICENCRLSRMPGLYGVQHGKYLHLWNGTAIQPKNDSEQQMNALLKNYITQLKAHDCTLTENCIRTWIFVQNVDVNYAGIVKARRELFNENGLTDKTHYIASTGISGRHADPKAIVIFDSYAVKGLEPGQIQYLNAMTHMSSTSEYGVTFERGTCIHYGDRRHVFVSGTASIDHKGRIVHEGDVGKQTIRMIENVETLLREAECETDDIAQMIVYLRDIADYTVAESIIGKQFPKIPKVVVLAPICRPGWLVEMECFAIKKNNNAKFEPL